MGAKSRTRAEKRKEIRKNTAFARLSNTPTSPRKMRLIADLVRGKRVELALHILKNNAKQPAERMHKLLLSAIANWQAKNEGQRIEDSDLFVKEIQVDGGRMLKRVLTAPQGRAHRIRKRSNHMTIILDSRNKPVAEPEETKAEVKKTPVKTAAKKELKKEVKTEVKKAAKPAAEKKAPKAKKETKDKNKKS
jgi:large subunit ribosomal protein L22